MSETTTKTVATKMFSEDDLSAIGSFSDAMALLNDARVEVVSTDDLGDGFIVCDNKDSLVKVPFVILNVKFSEGDHGEFSILHIVTEDGRKLILTDGSTGINKQAALYAGKGRTQGILCPRGLVRSDYEYDDVDSKTGEVKKKPATTYYLS